MTRQRSIAAIVVAAGVGTRASASGDPTPKQYRRLAGTPVLTRTLEALLGNELIDWVQPVIHPDHTALYDGLGVEHARLLPPVLGGAERQASVLKGLEALAARRPDLVLIHDAARPFADRALVSRVVERLSSGDAVVPVVKVTDTIKRSLDGDRVATTEDRQQLFAAQTPQGFRFPQILSAHMRAARLPRPFTDDAAIAEWAGLAVLLAEGSAANIKLTHPEDFERYERTLEKEHSMDYCAGTGIDFHQFEPGTSVWLGGVEIPHTHRLKGHSDADAALHALTDALYGALGEGDIGTHFPPSDPQWKGAPSRIFLEHAAGLVRQRGGRIVNVDLNIVCEAPRIGPHVARMRETIGAILGLPMSRVAVKATTSEKMGFAGRGEGLMAMASASVALPREG